MEVFNFGNHARDFTYIDDIVHGIILVLKSKNVFKPINKLKEKICLQISHNLVLEYLI